VTECTAEQSYGLNDAQRQRLALEALLGEPSPSWLVAVATVAGVTNLARFHVSRSPHYLRDGRAGRIVASEHQELPRDRE
jgi:hypothetical protein